MKNYRKFKNQKEYESFKATLRVGRLTRKRRLVNELGGKCIDCGYSAHLAALDFDHVDPTTKSFNIGIELSKRNFSELFEEAQKCVLRCANCHRIKTWPDATD